MESSLASSLPTVLWSAPPRTVARTRLAPIATRYKRASKADKGKILDELCATTGWHRNHARKALGAALRPKVVQPRRPRPPTYGPDVVAALRFCWAVLRAPTGKRLPGRGRPPER